MHARAPYGIKSSDGCRCGEWGALFWRGELMIAALIMVNNGVRYLLKRYASWEIYVAAFSKLVIDNRFH
jgi:hypothetical protein